MSEMSGQDGQVGDTATPAHVMPSAGALLRQAREAAGLHVAALAVSMRVPLKKLEALEADRHDLLPDAVFVRALAASVCRALKIDAAPILARLPQSGVPNLRADSSGINAPFQRPQDTSSAPFGVQMPKPALVAVLVLLAGAMILLFYPEEQDRASAQTVTQAPEIVTALPINTPAITTPVPEPSTVTMPPPQPAQERSLVALAQPAVPEPSRPPAVAVPTPPPTPAPAATAPASSQPATGVAQLIQFKTRGASWIEVIDAKGTILLRRNLEPGESMGVSSAALPLSVVVGRADATEVWVRGKSFALQSVSNENVARFEVK